MPNFDVTKAGRLIVVKELSEIGIDVRDPGQAVGTLSGGERQCLAIARAVHFGARVLILDEPTSALGVHQATMVLECMSTPARNRRLRRHLHLAQHPPCLCGRRPVHLLKRGKSTGTYLKNEISRDEVLNVMAGGKELVDLEQEIIKLNNGKR